MPEAQELATSGNAAAGRGASGSTTGGCNRLHVAPPLPNRRTGQSLAAAVAGHFAQTANLQRARVDPVDAGRVDFGVSMPDRFAQAHEHVAVSPTDRRGL